MKPIDLKIRNTLVLVISILLAGSLHAQNSRVDLTTEMVASVQAFLNSLSADQHNTATYSFDAEERLNWHFIPRPRNGLSFNDMNAAQRQSAASVLQTFLSEGGLEKVEQIRGLEAVLAEIEVNGRFNRDPLAYFFTVFGNPALDGTWAFRFEGHHIALNWTFVQGNGIASSPQFLGTNPAQVRGGAKDGLRVLAREEDLARQLVRSLDATQQQAAILQLDVPGDIFTAAEVEITPLENTGILFANLDSQQKLLLLNLVGEIAALQPELIAEQRMAEVRNSSEQIRFAWIGGTGETDAHYWRVQGASFLIEYDKVQNDANHIHLVWRDFDGDFGRDLIRLHYDAVAAAFGPGHRH